MGACNQDPSMSRTAGGIDEHPMVKRRIIRAVIGSESYGLRQG